MIRSHLAQANGHIAELTIQLTRQRVIVKYALDTGQPSELSESLLHALEEPRRVQEASRTGSRSVDTPTVRVRGIIQAPRPAGVWRRTGTCHNSLSGRVVTN